jgi:hypothetical protein
MIEETKRSECLVLNVVGRVDLKTSPEAEGLFAIELFGFTGKRWPHAFFRSIFASSIETELGIARSAIIPIN